MKALDSTRKDFLRTTRAAGAWLLVARLAGAQPKTGKEYEELGDAFEDKERQLFGKDGFEKIVAEVAGLEKRLGIYDLSRFTPK
jgi:hypothetical protein